MRCAPRSQRRTASLAAVSSLSLSRKIRSLHLSRLFCFSWRPSCSLHWQNELIYMRREFVITMDQDDLVSPSLIWLWCPADYSCEPINLHPWRAVKQGKPKQALFLVG